MSKPASRSLVALVAAFCLLAGTPLAGFAKVRRTTPARAAVAAKEDDKKADTAPPKLTKQERKYQEIKKFALDLYNKDPEFRDQVEDAYQAQMRKQSAHAYEINKRNWKDPIILGDGETVLEALYDNPLAQDYVNRVGQSVVPANSTRLYAFKITLNPIPEARSLSTGTIYVSTGLLSVIDNEAQLAYVLGHEIGHVEKDHWRDDVLVMQGMEPYNDKQAKKRALWGAVIGAAAGAVAGVASNSFQNAFVAGSLAFQLAPSLLKFAYPNAIVDWDRVQEDEADQLGLRYMLDRNYDPREVPKFFASLQRTSARDPRVGLGFMADADRVNERLVQVNTLLSGMGSALKDNMLVGARNLSEDHSKALDPQHDAAQRAIATAKSINNQMSAEIRAKLDAGELIGSTAEFESVMAELKRDNGIRAFDYDIFQMARTNLEESLQIRSNDPLAHFYYGKVLKLTARKPAEKATALAEFARAIDLDKRRVLSDARLHHALAQIDAKDDAQMNEIVVNLKEYVGLYQREHAGQLPPNMDVIYDYMQEAGELTWSAPPAVNVSTKNIEPVNVSAMSGGGSTVAPSAAVPAPTPMVTGRRP